MAVFKYVPEGMTKWVNQILDDIGGDGQTLKTASDKFKEQIDALLVDGVWTGSAAQANFDNFLATHNAFVKFANDFMTKFKDSITTLNTQVGQLETNNLGNADNVVLNEFSELELSDMDTKTISVDSVTYDYGKISEIGGKLDKIRVDLAIFQTNINTHLGWINDGSGSYWEGNAAESAKIALQDCVKSNMEEINSALETCINNIRQAGINAQTADSTAQ